MQMLISGTLYVGGRGLFNALTELYNSVQVMFMVSFKFQSGLFVEWVVSNTPSHHEKRPHC